MTQVFVLYLSNCHFFSDGVWGVFSSLKKAREAAEYFIKEYSEELQNYHKQPNGLYVYDTDCSRWTIEPLVMDTFH